MKTLFKKLFNNRNFASQALFTPIHEAIWNTRTYYNFAREGYIKNVIAFRAVNIIATAAASVPLCIYRNNKNGRFKQDSHPLLALLQRPNLITSKGEFIEKIVSYRLLSGNAYILHNAQEPPNELYVLRPDRIEIIGGTNNIPRGYKYRLNDKQHFFALDNITGKCAVLHLKNFHPLNDWYGLSPVESAAYSIDQHNQAGTWNQAMLQNGARPSGALVVKTDSNNNGKLSQEQYQRLKEQLEECYIGSKNAGKPMLLEGGLDWREMSLSPKDMDFIAGKHSAARDIALAFGMPPQLLGIPGDNTYSNLVEARIALWEQTVLPLLSDLLTHLNNWLAPLFARDLEITYNKDAVEILMHKREKLWQYIEKISFMTINEKRQVFGLSPIDGGNKLDNNKE